MLVGIVLFVVALMFVMVAITLPFVFVYPLIVDYKLDGLTAVKASAKAVMGNLGGVAGLLFLNFLMGLVGVMACYVGAIFIMPIGIAATAVAYRNVFPGGHNAPPRGEPRFSSEGEPLYGERDVVDLEKIRELGLPFWLAGGTGSPDGLRAALAAGAAGVQVGTLFAYCDESGLAPELRTRVLAAVAEGRVRIHTDPRASPTGYPFKVVLVEGLDHQDDRRERNCDLGYLRMAYRTPSGKLGYRCAAEPVEQYVAKGGDVAETVGRRCLCNGLTANIGQPQRRDAGDEPPLLTSGDDLVSLDLFAHGRARYSAADVIDYLCAQAPA